MTAARWTLIILMIVLGPLLWLTGVAANERAALAELAPGALSEPVFVDNYGDSSRVFVGMFAVVNLFFTAVFMPTARQLDHRRIATYFRAVVAACCAGALAWFEHTLNPVTFNWSGDPDGWSLVKDDVVPWADRIGAVWLVVVLVAAATVIVLAVASSVAEIRARRAGRQGTVAA